MRAVRGHVLTSGWSRCSLRQGDPPGEFFIVIKGAVEISVNHEGLRRVIATVRPTDEKVFIGELSVFNNQPRTARTWEIDLRPWQERF